MEATFMSKFIAAFIYSCISFSIVFIVLAGLTLMIYAMRLFSGNNNSSSSDSGTKAETPVVSTPASTAATPPQKVASVAVANVKAQHVAAITAAILTATHGLGKILSIAPTFGDQRGFSSGATQVWRTAATMEAISRRLPPTWKR